MEHRKKIFIAGFLLIALLVLGSIFQTKRTPSPNTPEETTATTQIETPAGVSQKNDSSLVHSFADCSGSIYRRGKLDAEPYKDWELWVWEINNCELKSGNDTSYLRLASRGKEIVWLKKISYEGERGYSTFPWNFFYEDSRGLLLSAVSNSQTLQLGQESYTVSIDTDFTGSELSIPEKIIYNTDNKSARYTNHRFLPKTNYELGLQVGYQKETGPILAHLKNLNEKFFQKGTYELKTSTPILSLPQNGDFIKTYTIPARMIKLGDSEYLPEQSYCQGREDLFQMSAVPQSYFDKGDLQKISFEGTRAFKLRDDHPHLNQAYTEYRDEYYKHLYQGYPYKLRTFDEFIALNPIIFIPNILGTENSIPIYETYFRREIVLLYLCEPIIYLYPETKGPISVSLPKSGVMKAEPTLEGTTWKVVADPKGTITTPENKTYPYLFWEGTTLPLPAPTTGFVVKREDISEFLDEKLQRLGLNNKEATDFKKAWVPFFTNSPYYLISFIPTETINKLAPLEISPKPKTVIRVLMDYKPLNQPMKFPEQKLPKAPSRSGFTVVEWGGIER